MWWQTEAFIQWKLFCTIQPAVCLSDAADVTCKGRGIYSISLPLEGNEISVVEIFLFSIACRQPVRHAHLIRCVPGVIYLAGNASGSETGCWRPFRAKFKNTWSYTATSSYVLMACCLITHITLCRRISAAFISSKWHSWTAKTVTTTASSCGDAGFDCRTVGQLLCLGHEILSYNRRLTLASILQSVITIIQPSNAI
jgi:hypothetical protein